MEKLRFRTNLKCNGCVNVIKSGIEGIPGVIQWNVDLASPDRLLEVESDADITDKILNTVKKAGYEINRL